MSRKRGGLPHLERGRDSHENSDTTLCENAGSTHDGDLFAVPTPAFRAYISNHPARRASNKTMEVAKMPTSLLEDSSEPIHDGDLAVTLRCKRGPRGDLFAFPRLPNGSIWGGPGFGAHNITEFSKDEAFRLVSSSGWPIAGHNDPPTKDWLPEPETCLRGKICQSELCSLLPLTARDVYGSLLFLLRAYDQVEMRHTQVFTRTNFERHQAAAKRLRTAIESLDDPRIKMTSGGEPLDSLLLSCRVYAAKLAWTADILDRKTRRNVDGDGQSLEAFIRGALSDCYKRLFGRDAGGNKTGPFARFGACFFEILGHEVAPSTIVRAVKKTPRAPKKKRSPA